jgi:hypothetical protein
MCSGLSAGAIETLLEFAGVKESKIYAAFRSGAMVYLHYVLQK